MFSSVPEFADGKKNVAERTLGQQQRYAVVSALPN